MTHQLRLATRTSKHRSACWPWPPLQRLAMVSEHIFQLFPLQQHFEALVAVDPSCGYFLPVSRRTSSQTSSSQSLFVTDCACPCPSAEDTANIENLMGKHAVPRWMRMACMPGTVQWGAGWCADMMVLVI